MASTWNNKPCPLCSEGTLRAGTQKKSLEYRGRLYEYAVEGAFCDHCHDGFPSHGDQDETAWESFRDKVDAEATPWRDVAGKRGNTSASVLRGARGKEKVTQARLAELTGISRQHISEMERGKRPIDEESAKKLAAALKTDCSVFL